jgi:hypothetical protein
VSGIVIEANVLASADHRASHVSENCVQACAEPLRKAASRHKLFLDESAYILEEYKRNVHIAKPPNPGAQFLLWIYRNYGNEERVQAVAIKEVGPPRWFAEFPDDPAFDSFDPDDRKYVAVAVASDAQPDIWNAVDSDWHPVVPALAQLGIRLTELCPADLAQD